MYDAESLAALHRADLEEAAAHHRRARHFRHTRRPSLPVRLYTRLWWAGRPRVAAWGPLPTGSTVT